MTEMSTFETELKNTLKEIDSFRTPECLDEEIIGSYAEQNLPEEEKERAEAHLQECLYCLKRLNDAKEMLYWRAHPAQLSPELGSRLKGLLRPAEKKSKESGLAERFFERLKAVVVFPAVRWRYPAVALAAACVAILVNLFVANQENRFGMVPHVDANSFVKVHALDAGGAVVNEAQGVVLGRGGLIASDLSKLAGASAIRIASRNGKTYRTTRLWRDDEKNLAVMKIDDESLPSIPTADISEISIGQAVFLVGDAFSHRADQSNPFAGQCYGSQPDLDDQCEVRRWRNLPGNIAAHRNYGAERHVGNYGCADGNRLAAEGEPAADAIDRQPSEGERDVLASVHSRHYQSRLG